MARNKVLKNTPSLRSQGSLSVVKEIKPNDNNEIESVDVLLVPPGKRHTTHVDLNFKETTVRVRKKFPVALERGIKA